MVFNPPLPAPPPIVSFLQPQIPKMGVEIMAPEKGQDTGLVIVFQVAPGGACDRAGIAAGDILVKWDDVALTSKPLFHETLATTRPGVPLPVYHQHVSCMLCILFLCRLFGVMCCVLCRVFCVLWYILCALLHGLSVHCVEF